MARITTVRDFRIPTNVYVLISNVYHTDIVQIHRIMRLWIFLALLTLTQAVKLVPAHPGMGLLPKVYTWPSMDDCKALHYPSKRTEDAVTNLACVLISAEHEMLRVAGALARVGDDRSVYSQADVDAECETAHRASRAGTIAINRVVDELQDSDDHWADVKGLTDKAVDLVTKLRVPDVSRWCGPDEFAVGLEKSDS